MAEEFIRMQEGRETASEPAKAEETMGTVISMESVKQVSADNLTQQQEQEEAKTSEPVPEEVPLHQQIPGEELKHEETAAGPVFYEPPVTERKENTSLGRQEESSGHVREKKRASDYFHLRKDVEGFTREDWILSRLPEEDLMGYLTMEQKKNEMLREAKELKEKRIFTTLQIAISLSAIVAVVALLKENPTVLVNILYITGIVIALWIWRGKQDK